MNPSQINSQELLCKQVMSSKTAAVVEPAAVVEWLARRKVEIDCNFCFHTRTMFSINLEFGRKGIFR